MMWVVEHDESQWKLHLVCRKGRINRFARYRSDRTGLRLWEINV